MKITNNDKFIQVVADEGMKCTTYDGSDIKNYSSFNVGCFPVNYDISNIQEITDAEDEMNINAQMEAIEDDNTL